MFHPLPTPKEMADWDRQAMDDFGIKPEMLMENAARAAVDALLAEVNCRGLSILIFCGPGNNGGDGFSMARRLQDLGARPLVVHTKPKKSYRGEARYHLDLARRTGVPTQLLARYDFTSCPAPDVVIDALLGTGFSGDLRSDMLALVHRINRMNCFTMAVDCPTGLDAATGYPLPDAVRANMTATMHAIKLGMALPHAGEYTGRVRMCEIGIPAQIPNTSKAMHQLITHDIMQLAPLSTPDMHKGVAGHLLVIGGSHGLTGAAHLTALSGLRAGAGLSTIACPAELSAQVKHGSPDVMTLPLGQGSIWTEDMAEAVLAQLHRFDAVVIGPGLGRSKQTEAFLAALLPKLDMPCVLDADGLYHLAAMPELTPFNAVLTPHPGEMAHLLGTDIESIQADRFGAARKLAERTKATVVLKGAGTVVVDASKHSLTASTTNAYLSSIDAPNLAVAGSGDVLAGLIGSLLARRIAPLPGACLGVYWHGLVGKTLAKDFPGRGNLASEIADALPKVLANAHKETTC